MCGVSNGERGMVFSKDKGWPNLEEELNSRGQGTPRPLCRGSLASCPFLLRPPGGSNNPNNPTITVPRGAVPCTAHHTTFSHQANTFVDGDIEGLAEEQTQNQGHQPVSVADSGCRPWGLADMEAWAPLGSPEQVWRSCCGFHPGWSLQQPRPLCPPALPAVSATPGTRVPCGNLTSLVHPPRTQLVWGDGREG